MAKTVPAVARALSVLELFLDSDGPVSVPEMVVRLRLPRSTTHELVQTLVSRGYLSPAEGHPNQFVLGVRVFELGSVYAAKLDLAREGGEIARQVAANCGETVQLAILDGNEVVYIAKADSVHLVRLVSAVGRRLPAHLTGLGKMLLSGLSDDAVRARYGGSEQLVGMTPNSITSMNRLLQELAQVRAQGLAFDYCESNIDIQCVAAPVHDHESNMVAAMSIAVPITRMSHERRAELTSLIQDGAMELSRRLGYKPALRALLRAVSVPSQTISKTLT